MKEDQVALQYSAGPPNNFRLPTCHFPGDNKVAVDDRLYNQSQPQRPCRETLAAAIAQGCSSGAVDLYLDSYPPERRRKIFSGLVHGCYPVLFYAIEVNDADCVRAILKYQPNVNKAIDSYGIPALAFAMLRAHYTVVNHVEVVKALLSFGANPRVIPEDMWCDYLGSPSPHAPTDMDSSTMQQVHGAPKTTVAF